MSISQAFPAIWIGLFLVFNVVYLVRDNVNGWSRYVLIEAIVNEGSFRIDDYIHRTQDWSQTPDGSYFSNKAPGPSLLGVPVLYGLQKTGVTDVLLTHKIICFITQILPMAILSLLLLSLFRRESKSLWQQHLVLVGILFGNTSALFMNTFFGHGLAAFWILLLWFAYKKSRFLLVGFSFGWLILTDYAAAFVLPVILFLILRSRVNRGKALAVFSRIGVGGVLPGLLWIIYHYICFGSIFTLPNRFQNPIFVTGSENFKLWGIFSAVPSLDILCELLVGWTRGISWTQPWVWIVAMAFISLRKLMDLSKVSAVVLGYGTLIFLLGMNASFNGWHGGHTPGPRYLSVAFPLIAVAISELPGSLPRVWRRALWLSMVPCLVLFAAVYSTGRFSPESYWLWPYYLDLVTSARTGDIEKIKFVACAFVLLFAFVLAYSSSEGEFEGVVDSGKK